MAAAGGGEPGDGTARDGAARGGGPADGAAGGGGPGDSAAGGDGAARGGGRGLPWLHGREGVPWLYLLSSSKELSVNLAIGRLVITDISNNIATIDQRARDFFDHQRPMVTKEGKDLTPALEEFMKWCIRETRHKIYSNFEPSVSNNRPLKKAAVALQSLTDARPDAVLLTSLFYGQRGELDELIKLLSAQLNTVLFQTMRAAGDMYVVWWDLPADPKVSENIIASLEKARLSARRINDAVDRMTDIESLLAAAPADVRRLFSFRTFVPSTE